MTCSYSLIVFVILLKPYLERLHTFRVNSLAAYRVMTFFYKKVFSNFSQKLQRFMACHRNFAECVEYANKGFNTVMGIFSETGAKF